MNLSVVYSSDDQYAQHVGVSMLSLFHNNQDFNHIDIYLMERNISTENKKRLKLIGAEYNRTIHLINFQEFTNKLKVNIGNSISLNAYARLFLPSAINETVDKIIYMDCDSVINESLKDLWEKELDDYYAAGVLDTVSDGTKEKVNMDVDLAYINSGMLLINLKKWREDDIEKRFLKFIERYNGEVFHHDQGTINGVLNEKFLILHPKYNAMTPYFTMKKEGIIQYYGLKDYYSETELKEAVNKPVFIHYTPAFVNRPWIKGCKHPLASLYHQYLEMTPWKGNALGKDNRRIIEKFVAFLYNHLPFKMANGIAMTLFR